MRISDWSSDVCSSDLNIIHGSRHRDGSIELEGRKIATRARCKGMAWFDFAALCEGPRGASDYIEIAREFHTVLLGKVPVMDAHMDDAARRFVTLVDELYDRNVNLDRKSTRLNSSH